MRRNMAVKINGNMIIKDGNTDLKTLKELNTQVINNTNKLIDYVKIDKYTNNTQYRFSAGESKGLAPQYRNIDGYKWVECIGGHPNGNTGVLVYDNGWAVNLTSETRSVTITWINVYIKI